MGRALPTDKGFPARSMELRTICVEFVKVLKTDKSDDV